MTYVCINCIYIYVDIHIHIYIYAHNLEPRVGIVYMPGACGLRCFLQGLIPSCFPEIPGRARQSSRSTGPRCQGRATDTSSEARLDQCRVIANMMVPFSAYSYSVRYLKQTGR